MKKLLLALMIAITAVLSFDLATTPTVSQAGLVCTVGPIQGGTDEPNQFGMYPPVQLGRICGDAR